MTVPVLFALALIGLFAGGLINYTAYALLRADNPFSPSFPSSTCQHRLSPWEAIPFCSFCFPDRNCPHCWHRLRWQYPLIEILTACVFLIIAWRFHLNPYAAGIMIFIAVLITVCITDFKAKIIPHEITYPAIILGIIFSAQVRGDILGSLAGIGVSYILFDFLAFYGLQVYLWLNQPTIAPSQQFLASGGKSASASAQKPVRSFWFSNAASQTPISLSTSAENLTARLSCKGIPVEELEVIGGGDAVLAALIASWLGWQKLIVALLVGFVAGAILGAVYLLAELWKQKLMSTLLMPVTFCMLALSFLAGIILTLLAYVWRQPAITMPYLSVLPVTLVAGLFLGVIVAGSKLSKPFPFGPALAAGAIVAIFT